VAATHGHFFSLGTAQARALAVRLGRPGTGPGGPPLLVQWVHLASGRWSSEKDPGYPFLATPFQALGLIRLAPLFFGAIACAGLFAGGRSWLGRSCATCRVARTPPSPPRGQAGRRAPGRGRLSPGQAG
jgi:hypothetical protein